MAFIGDDMPVLGDEIGDDALPHQALHESDIDVAARLLLPAVDDAEPVRRDIQEGLETRHPLIEKLPAMDEHQRIPISLRDHFGRNDGLAECRSRGKHPGFMQEKGGGGIVLFRGQLTEKPYPEGPPLLAFIAQRSNNAQCRGKRLNRSSRHPRGRAICFENSSAQEMMRGLPNVGRRMACAA